LEVYSFYIETEHGVVQGKFPVIDQVEIAQDAYRITIESETIARESQPGQFVQLRISEGIDPLLRRPFSIHRVQRNKNCLDLFYKVVGRGTHLMKTFKKGDTVDLMGPLGKGFAVDRNFPQAVIVAGGMGSAPIFFLIDELLADGKKVALYWGVKEKREIYSLSELKKASVEVHIATEDGSMGHEGMVTDLFKSSIHIHKNNDSLRGFVCGPKGMIRAMQKIAEKTRFQWQVSMEERMACGVGVCMGCGVKMKSGITEMACTDGPVFNLSEVSFDG
jgi:dihydroorotate dehydrogenase electron transfer subunit